MTVISLDPCGINTTHVHPRAAEFLILVEGSSVRFGSILENGLVGPGEKQEVTSAMNRFEMTALPQGSMHWQFNDGCEKAVLVVALSSGNPGTNQMINFFQLDLAIVNATLGSPGSLNGGAVETFGKLIPANLVRGAKSCLARCNRR